MTIIDNEMLWHQFGAAIDVFGSALRDCPDGLWEKGLWEDQPDQWAAGGFLGLWYLCCLRYSGWIYTSPERNRTLLRLRY